MSDSPHHGLGRPGRSHAETRRVWADRLRRFADSPLTVAEFCAAEGVSIP